MQIRFDRGTILIDQRAPRVDPTDVARRGVGSARAGVAGAGRRLRPPRHPARAGASSRSTPSYPITTCRRWRGRCRTSVGTSVMRWPPGERRTRRGVIALPTGAGKTMIAVAAHRQLGRSSAVPRVRPACSSSSGRRVLSRHVAEVGRLGDGEHRVASVTVATYASAIAWAPTHRRSVRPGDRRRGPPCGRPSARADGARDAGRDRTARAHRHAADRGRGARARTPSWARSYTRSRSTTSLVTPSPTSISSTIPIRLSDHERTRYDEARRSFAATFASFQRAAPGADWADVRHRGACEARTAGACSRHGGLRRRSSRTPRTSGGPCATCWAGTPIGARWCSPRTTGLRYEIAREFLVHPITHEIGRGERARVLQRFDAGDVNVLVSAPGTRRGRSTCRPRRSRSSSAGRRARGVTFSAIGRVLRPAPGKRARVYELVVADSVEVAQVRRRRSGLLGVGEHGGES